tara:strand:- start:507 stop:710 length:204 start_codon:yes stop_codon:yes gene_type:complete
MNYIHFNEIRNQSILAEGHDMTFSHNHRPNTVDLAAIEMAARRSRNRRMDAIFGAIFRNETRKRAQD